MNDLLKVTTKLFLGISRAMIKIWYLRWIIPQSRDISFFVCLFLCFFTNFLKLIYIFFFHNMIVFKPFHIIMFVRAIRPTGFNLLGEPRNYCICLSCKLYHAMILMRNKLNWIELNPYSTNHWKVPLSTDTVSCLWYWEG